nr:unnamed protein product [Spirometra erinaceieuropaei]
MYDPVSLLPSQTLHTFSPLSQLNMDAYASLIEMGFLEFDIQEALCSGCSSAAEVVDFICNARSGKTPSKTVAPLRLSKEIKSQFQSSLPQTVVLSTGESVEATGSVPSETPAQEGLPPTSGAASSTGESQQQQQDSLPKLRVLGVSGTAVTDAGWCSVASVPGATPRPLRALDLSGTSGFTDTGLLHVVRIFPCLKSLMMSNTQVTGLPSENESPVLHLRRLEVNNCTSLVRLPACLIPSVDAGGELVKLSLHGCARLDVGSVLTSLHGHPIQDLDGLPKLPQLTQDHLLEFTKLNFPLRKLSLSVTSLSGMTLELLVRLLKPLPATSLQELDLPLKRVACDSDPSALLEELVETLTRLKRLVSLDLGGQAVLFSPTQLARACGGLNSLASLRAENLSRPQEESLQSVLPSKCTLRIRYHCDTE